MSAEQLPRLRSLPRGSRSRSRSRSNPSTLGTVRGQGIIVHRMLLSQIGLISQMSELLRNQMRDSGLWHELVARQTELLARVESLEELVVFLSGQLAAHLDVEQSRVGALPSASS